MYGELFVHSRGSLVGLTLGRMPGTSKFSNYITMKMWFQKKGTRDFFVNGIGIEASFIKQRYDQGMFSFQLSDHFPFLMENETDINVKQHNQIVPDSKKT